MLSTRACAVRIGVVPCLVSRTDAARSSVLQKRVQGTRNSKRSEAFVRKRLVLFFYGVLGLIAPDRG